MRPSFRLASVTVVTLLLAQTGVSRTARACGGFFCDRPPVSGDLPIAQAAENVLFVLDTDPETGQGRVEAHIQILYQGSADQFSWVVPVTATPTLDVGNDILFDRLEPMTRPRYQLTWATDGRCQGTGGGGDGIGCAGSSTSASASPGVGTPGAGGAVEQPAVQVLFRGNVGPYDSAVIKSDDPGALKTWLTTNGYFVSSDAARIVDEYVAAHNSFVALRLRKGQDTSAIRPIVLRLPATEACLPLKLTAIAATPDVRINVWVLGDGRAVPINYAEIGLNFARLDWFSGGKNYNELLGQAADEAGGNAFAVEYAQPTADVAGRFLVTLADRRRLLGFVEPMSYLAELARLGFGVQGAVLDVLRKDLPLPADLAAMGVTEADYYQNLARYWFRGNGNSLDTPFDAAGLTADLGQQVFTQLEPFQPLFQNHRTLTRLATFISPDEMTKDPIFVTNRDLPAVSPVHNVTATMLCGDQAFGVCQAPVRIKTDDGVEIVYPVDLSKPGGCPSVQPTYDRGDLDRLPASTVGYARAADSEGTVSVDHRAAITAALSRHNAAALAAGSDGGACSIPGRTRSVLPAMAVLLWAATRRRRRRG